MHKLYYYFRKFLWVYLSIWPLFLYLYAFTFVYNVPFGDDMDALFVYATQISTMDFFGVVKSLFQQHSEHRIILVRISVIILESLNFLNMKVLDFEGILFIISSFYMSAKYLQVQNFSPKKGLILFGIALAFFSPFQYKMIAWPMAIISQAGVFFMAFLSFYFIIEKKCIKTFFVACFLGFLCVFSNGNGVLLSVSSVYLFIKFYIATKRISKRFSYYALFIMVFTMLYFYGYSNPLHHPPITMSFLAFFIYMCKLFDILKANFDLFLGFSFFCFIIAVFLTNIKKLHSLFPEAMIVFSISSIAATVFLRAGFYVDSMQVLPVSVPERHIYPIIFLTASVLLLFKHKIFTIKLDKVILSFFVFLLAGNFVLSYSSELNSFKQFASTNYLNYYSYLKDDKPFYLSGRLKYVKTSYKFPENCLVTLESESKKIQTSSKDSLFSFDIKEMKNNNGYTFINGRIYFKSTNDHRFILLLVSPSARYRVQPHVDVFNKNFQLIINNKHFKSGDYKVFVNFPHVNDMFYDVGKVFSFPNKNGNYPFGLNNKMSVGGVVQCAGFIDTFSHNPNSVLETNGWVAKSTEAGTLHEQTLLAFTDSAGKKKFFSVSMTPRPDVGTAFNKPGLNNSGFQAKINLDEFSGEQTVNMAVRNGDVINICSNLEKKIALPTKQ